MSIKQIAFPSTTLISGPSQSGKSHFMCNVIKQRNHLIDSKAPINDIAWFSPTSITNKLDNVLYYQRLPNMKDLQKKTGIAKIIVLDDYLSDIRGEAGREIIKIVLNGTHHLQICLFILVQNMFAPHLRTISLNCQYLIIFKSPRSTDQIQCLLRQIYGKQCQNQITAVNDILSRPYAYVFLDLHQLCPEAVRIRTNILCSQGEEEAFCKIYMPIDAYNGLLAATQTEN